MLLVDPTGDRRLIAAGTVVDVLCVYPVDGITKVRAPDGLVLFVHQDNLAPVLEESVIGRTIWDWVSGEWLG